MDEKGQGRRYFTNNKKLSDLTHLKFICILSFEVLRFLFWERSQIDRELREKELDLKKKEMEEQSRRAQDSQQQMVQIGRAHV